MSWYVAENRVEELREELKKALEMLHEIWAVSVDKGGQTDEENREIQDRAQAMLKEYGIEV